MGVRVTGARPIGQMVNDLAPRQTQLSGTCPDNVACGLPVFCTRLCWRLEGELIQAELRANLAELAKTQP
jgi:hypothetical protein